MVLAISANACVSAMTPRLPVPLPDHSIAVGGFVQGAAGHEWDSDTTTLVAVAGGGCAIAVQAVKTPTMTLEFDGALGGAFMPRRSFVENYLGASAGTRAWTHIDTDESWAIGADFNLSAFLEVARPPRSGSSKEITQIEARAMVAHRLADEIWIGTRPGVVMPRKRDEVVIMFDLPIAAVWQGEHVRVGFEAGVLGNAVPPAPTTVHIGVAASYLF
jgi:hypothetical protein